MNAVALAIAFELLGFSPKGEHMALLEHGVEDNRPWARVRLIDVKKNKVLDTLINVDLEGASEDEAIKQVKQQLGAALAKRRIDRLFAVPPVVRLGNELRDRESAPLANVEIATRGLKPHAPCDAPFEPLGLAVRLHLMGGTTPITLLDEKKLPVDRACMSTCTLNSVYARGKGVVALVECSTPDALVLIPATAMLKAPLAEDPPQQTDVSADVNHDGETDRVSIVTTTQEAVLEAVDHLGGRLFLQSFKKNDRPTALQYDALTGEVTVLFAVKTMRLTWDSEKGRLILVR